MKRTTMSKPTARPPVFGELPPDDCWKLLGRNHVGRLAFFNHGAVDIEPVSFVAASPWIFVRSADGTKLEVFDHHPYVAFEVDEVAGPFDWLSVVARGTVYMMADSGSPVDRAIYQKALKTLRSAMPTVLTADDPAPSRTHVYGIHVDRITGRTAEQRTRRRGTVPVTPVRALPPSKRGRGGGAGW